MSEFDQNFHLESLGSDNTRYSQLENKLQDAYDHIDKINTEKESIIEEMTVNKAEFFKEKEQLESKLKMLHNENLTLSK